MRKSLILISFIFLLPIFIKAQKVEITPFGGYVFPVTIHGYNGSAYFYGNAQYGGSISFLVNPFADLQIMYNRIDTKARPEIYGYNQEDVKVSVNYIMAGFMKNFRVNPKVSPFIGIDLGACMIDPKDTEYYAQWFFAVGAEGGAKIYLSDRIGLRLQAQLMMPVQYGGFTFYYGSSGGGSGVSLSSTMVDFGFTGGLIFRIGK